MFRVNKTLIGFTPENYEYLRKWKQAFEYTVGTEVSTEIAVNAIIGAMRVKSETIGEEEMKENKISA